MKVISYIKSFFSKKTVISSSRMTPVYTKYGLFQIIAYKNKDQECLAITSNRFSNLATHIVYIHSDAQVHIHAHTAEDYGCYCDNQLEIMLKMIRKEGGVALYLSKNPNNIDGLLRELQVRKLQENVNTKNHTTVALDLYADDEAYQTIDFIFRDLHLKKIYLVAADAKIIDIAKELGIEVVKRVSAVGIVYADLE